MSLFNKNSSKASQNFGKILIRILSFVKPFFGLFLLSVFLNTIFSTFTTISIALIKPVFQILFSVDDTTTNTAIGFFDNLKNGFFVAVNSLIEVPGDKQSSLMNLSFLVISVFLIKNLFKYLSSVASVRLEEGIIKSIRDKVFSRLTSLSVDFFTKKKSGEIISIITNDVTVVNTVTIATMNGIIREMIQIFLYLILLLTISSYLTLIAFSTSIISFILIRSAMKYLRRYATRMQKAMAEYTTSLQETISGIRVVKAYNAEEVTNKRFFDQTKKYVVSAVKHLKIITIIPSINEIFAVLALCVVLLVGGYFVLSGQMKADDLMLFLFSLFTIMSPISTVINNISQFQRGFVAAERVFNIIDEKPTVQSGTSDIKGFNNKIQIQNVSFAYNDIDVIKNVSFDIEKSKKIALVGASGSGKSTMLDLIIRFYDPVKGTILLDGTDITELKIESYRSLFGIVAQETVLFNDTIANNIRYGLENITEQEIMEAAKLANAYDFVMKLPNGFNTYIGDRGIMLSGGERQRVSIARALIRKPQILVFDEATSALDTESEKIVQDAINSSMRDKTAIIVAHRLSTIIDCDEIIVFDNGKIVECGNHIELYNQCGVYRKLYDLQFVVNNPSNDK